MQKQGVVPQAWILHYLYITYSKCTEKEYGIKYAQFISQKYWFSYMTRWWTDFIMNWRDYAFSIYNKMPHYLTDHIAQVHSWSKTKWNLGIYIYGLDHILFCTSSNICVAVFALLGCCVALVHSLQHLFFSASSVLCITVCKKYISIYPHSAVVTISHTKFPFCCSAR